LHSKLLPDSVDVKLNVASVWLLGSDGPDVMLVFGGVVSMVQVRFAGLESVLPASSIARTRKVCAPSVSGAVVYGVVHVPQAPASRRHWKVPGSLELNVNVGCDEPSVPLGPDVIVVWGAAVSTVQLRVAGVGSVLPAPSRARTSNVCEPFGSWL
jgi:hypothetical protein